MPSFKDKVVIVTGGASGIGKAAVELFAQEGAIVMLADINKKAADNVAKTVNKVGKRVHVLQVDITKATDVQRMVDETLRRYNRLDCAFNNAGITTPACPTAELTEEVWDRVIAINLKGVWLCMKYEIPAMLKNGSGAIVNMSSIAGLVGSIGWPAYHASKHGVIGLTKSAALEYSKNGVRVNAICPCLTDTPLVGDMLDGRTVPVETLTTNIPMGRLGTPREVAAAAVWLCSDTASLITGATIAVDGGYTAR